MSPAHTRFAPGLARSMSPSTASSASRLACRSETRASFKQLDQWAVQYAEKVVQPRQRIMQHEALVHVRGEHLGEPAYSRAFERPPVLVRVDPAHTRACAPGGARRARLDAIAVDERGNRDSRRGAGVVPEVEAGVDLQEVEALRARVALEIDLGDTRKADALEDGAPESPHLVVVGDLDMGGETVEARRGADLAP